MPKFKWYPEGLFQDHLLTKIVHIPGDGPKTTSYRLYLGPFLVLWNKTEDDG